MALIATDMGWRENPETGADEFFIVLKAETQDDIPVLNASDVWTSTPLTLSRADVEA